MRCVENFAKSAWQMFAVPSVFNNFNPKTAHGNEKKTKRLTAKCGFLCNFAAVKNG